MIYRTLLLFIHVYGHLVEPYWCLFTPYVMLVLCLLSFDGSEPLLYHFMVTTPLFVWLICLLVCAALPFLSHPIFCCSINLVLSLFYFFYDYFLLRSSILCGANPILR